MTTIDILKIVAIALAIQAAGALTLRQAIAAEAAIEVMF